MYGLDYSNLLRNMWTVLNSRAAILMPLLLLSSIIPALRAFLVVQQSIDATTNVALQVVAAGVSLLVQAIATLIVLDVLDGRDTPMSEMVSHSASRLLPTLLTGVLFYAVVIAGTVLLIIPGVIASLMFFPAMSVTLVEGVGPFASMKRAQQLMNGHKAALFGSMVLIGLFVLGIYFASMLAIGICVAAVGNAGLLLAVPVLMFVLALYSTLPGVVYHALVRGGSY